MYLDCLLSDARYWWKIWLWVWEKKRRIEILVKKLMSHFLMESRGFFFVLLSPVFVFCPFIMFDFNLKAFNQTSPMDVTTNCCSHNNKEKKKTYTTTTIAHTKNKNNPNEGRRNFIFFFSSLTFGKHLYIF